MNVGMIALNRGGVAPLIMSTNSLLQFATVEVRLHVVVNNESEHILESSPWLKRLRDMNPGIVKVNLYNTRLFEKVVNVSMDGFRGGSTGNR